MLQGFKPIATQRVQGRIPPKGGPVVLLDPTRFLKPSFIYSYFCVCGVGRGFADSRGELSLHGVLSVGYLEMSCCLPEG